MDYYDNAPHDALPAAEEETPNTIGGEILKDEFKESNVKIISLRSGGLKQLSAAPIQLNYVEHMLKVPKLPNCTKRLSAASDISAVSSGLVLQNSRNEAMRQGRSSIDTDGGASCIDQVNNI